MKTDCDNLTLPAVPAGSPRWVTPELLAETIRVWQPYYGDLQVHDALTIILNMGSIYDALRSRSHEEIHCSCAC